ncbi:hypothetical protein K469DRAFT_657856 [Zopfia rhizophila CBS 207.26]|uniref:C3H1-type domain-containing protein n=1 Tax=Zopfia rhizophila CBS 207.26 TaxID=1314779 RepID=A0A6A6EEG4_9PEZI|nr:hypothetical protein K469DRAFT_657856 [Zopfia rhizophila CBS 207.26]
MSPANHKSPVDTALMTNGEDSSSSASLWVRFEQITRNDTQKTALIQELLMRYDYLSEQYRKECQDREREHEEIRGFQRDRKLYQDHLFTLQRAIERDPFVMILIDGDGMIFSDDFIKEGEIGGRKAAATLQTAILDYVQREVDTVPTDVKVVCRVYANIKGLAEVLVRAGIVEEIGLVEEFTRGFTRGKTLFDFVDVGPGKDRADDKLIETFKLYLHDFHCRHIFFGCSHDNGYARILEDVITDPSYVHRITLLEGVPVEKELFALPFATKKLPGLFRDTKLYVWGAQPAIRGYTPPIAKTYPIVSGLPARFPPPRREASQGSLNGSPILPNRTPSNSTLASNDVFPALANPQAKSWAAKAAAPPPPVTEAPTYKPSSREELIARNRAGQRVDPPCRDYNKEEIDRVKKLKMCNVHFLRQECPYGTNCTHIHDYKPTAGEIATLRLVARMAPCQNGSACQDVKCIYGHKCPSEYKVVAFKGTKNCVFGDKCKFPLEMHGIDCNVVKTLVIR